MNGKLVWQKDLGDKRMRNEFGEGSTPALHGRYLIVVWDHQGESFVVALDKRTGDEIWRMKRDEIDSWATPLVVEHGGRAQVVTVGMNRLRSYDLETGKIVWESAGLTMNPIPSPVAGDGMVFATSGFRGNSLKAINLADAKGEITGAPALAWTLDRDTPVRAVAAAVSWRALHPQDQLGCAVRVRGEDRHAAISGAADRGGAQRLRVAGRGGRPGLRCRPGRDDRGPEGRTPRSRSSEPTRSTTTSMRRRRWSIGRCFCAERNICTAWRTDGADNGPSSPSRGSIAILIVLGRGGVELPAMAVALGDLVRRLELLVVLYSTPSALPMSSTRSWSGVGLSPPGASSPTA